VRADEREGERALFIVTILNKRAHNLFINTFFFILSAVNFSLGSGKSDAVQWREYITE
jgi:hypothetical protein